MNAGLIIIACSIYLDGTGAHLGFNFFGGDFEFYVIFSLFLLLFKDLWVRRPPCPPPLNTPAPDGRKCCPRTQILNELPPPQSVPHLYTQRPRSNTFTQHPRFNTLSVLGLIHSLNILDSTHSAS